MTTFKEGGCFSGDYFCLFTIYLIDSWSEGFGKTSSFTGKTIDTKGVFYHFMVSLYPVTSPDS